VDVEAFLRELPELFDDFPRSERPRDPRFAEVLDAVPGLAEPNNLALLNLAARHVSAGESYAEAGTFRGTSLISVLLGNDDLDAVAIDNFSFRDGTRAQLDRNLARFDLAKRPTVVEGDVFDVLRGDALVGKRIGVWYYDAGHEYEQQLDGLRLIEPYLADEALLIVDDSDWERVDRAIADYLASQPRAQEVLRLDGDDRGAKGWWKGVSVLRWAET
jgi:predicted O-methyltransferase YrrM